MADYLKIAQVFKETNYHISATGFRGVGQNELASVLKILSEVDPENIQQALDSLYKYYPDTIKLNKSWRRHNCDRFNDNCDCYLPDMSFEDCYCQRQRREKLLSHDRRNYKEYAEWRLSVFKRDNFTCQECGQVGGELNAHHIKSYKKYPKLRITLSNGTTLCKECHKRKHKKRGKSKNGKTQ